MPWFLWLLMLTWRRLWRLGRVPVAVYRHELEQVSRAVELELRALDKARKAAA